MNKLQLLKDPLIFPSDEVLAKELGDVYSFYADLTKRLKEISIEIEWRYYNDGKAWLGKNTYKKKTVFWLSVWEGFFQVSLFFSDKTYGGLLNLQIDNALKKFEPKTGKLIPLVVKIDSNIDLNDLYKIIEFKKNLK